MQNNIKFREDYKSKGGNFKIEWEYLEKSATNKRTEWSNNFKIKIKQNTKGQLRVMVK